MTDLDVIHKAICDHFGVDTFIPKGKTTVAWQLAKHIDAALTDARYITTVEQLRAIEPGDNELAGPLIKSLGIMGENGATGLGEVYEQNTDGTWCLLCMPGTTGSWGERALNPQDIALPAILLWSPA